MRFPTSVNWCVYREPVRTGTGGPHPIHLPYPFILPSFRNTNISALNIRNIIIISIIGLSIFLFVVKPYPISRLPFFPISAVEAIPSNAGVCFEMKSLQAFRTELEKNNSLEKLEKLFVFQQYKRDFNLLENILKKDSLRQQRLLVGRFSGLVRKLA